MKALAQKDKVVSEQGSEGGEDESQYYDEMDYGDELNDQEEKEYKAELLRQQQVKKDLPKRATRGLRM